MRKNISDKHLPRVALGNATFVVDHKSRELREAGFPENRIPFDRLQPDAQTGSITLIFDKLTRNLYNGYLPETGGLPPMTQKLSFPPALLLGASAKQSGELQKITAAREVTETMGQEQKQQQRVTKTQRQQQKPKRSIRR